MKLCMSESYNQHSRSQSSLWELAKEQGLLDDALSAHTKEIVAAEERRNESIVGVAELGCATGGNSLGPLSFFANSIGSKTTKLEILLVDRPENHWEILFETVTPQAILSYSAQQEKHSNAVVDHPAPNNALENSLTISIKSVPKCFYELCSEEASVDLSYSFSATHWMKAIPNHHMDPCFAIFPTCPSSNSCQNSLEEWQKAAQIQLCEFATSRARELKPGGRFLGSFACLEARRNSAPWSRMGKLVRDVATEKLCNNDFTKEERWPRALVNAFSKGIVGTLPIAFRTQEELLEVFSERNGWRVLRCEYAFAKDPLQTVYRKNLAFESLSRHEKEHIKREYAQATMQSWKAACLEGLVMSTTTKDGISQQIARDFWDSVCNDSVERMLREDGCDDTRLSDRYNLGIPAHFILVERVNNSS